MKDLALRLLFSMHFSMHFSIPSLNRIMVTIVTIIT